MSYVATAQCYAEWDTNPTTLPLHGAYTTWSESTLKENFGGTLEFGTAGLRGPMGVGSTRMNEVTVMQAAQGVVSHLLASVPSAASQGVVIGYDHRGQGGLTSRRFALLTAAACVAKGVKCYLYSQLVATPLVPFGILHLGAAAGIMVTASHNPKMDNGYKVYWGNGSQIISPVDKAIAAAIVANARPWVPYGPAVDGGAGEAALLSHPLLSDPLSTVLPAYLQGASKDLSLGATGRLPATTLPMHHRVTYTAMHGVGTPYIAAMFQAFKLPPFTPTPQQVQPDPNFSTVAFPNPEEGAGALALAMASADAAGDNVILANDPDADRLAVAEWVPAGATASSPWAPRTPASSDSSSSSSSSSSSGRWRVFTGNEIGVLLASWLWRRWREDHPHDPPSSVGVMASTVSSKFLAAMAGVEGCVYKETLTGFKWMGNAMAEWEGVGGGGSGSGSSSTESNKSTPPILPLFSMEEAIGYACWRGVRDKDGVVAGAVMGEAAAVWASEGLTLCGALAQAYGRYGGERVANNGYVKVSDPGVTAAIFQRLIAEGRYWGRCGGLGITAIRDLKAPGWDSGAPGGIPTLALSSSSNMLTYTFTNGCTLTLRSSGTEPKLKWYSEGPSVQAVDDTVATVVREMLETERWGLAAPPPFVRWTW